MFLLKIKIPMDTWERYHLEKSVFGKAMASSQMVGQGFWVREGEGGWVGSEGWRGEPRVSAMCFKSSRYLLVFST